MPLPINPSQRRGASANTLRIKTIILLSMNFISTGLYGSTNIINRWHWQKLTLSHSPDPNKPIWGNFHGDYSHLIDGKEI